MPELDFKLCSHCGQPLGKFHKKLELLSGKKEIFRYHSDCYFAIQPEIEKRYITASAKKRAAKLRQKMKQEKIAQAIDHVLYGYDRSNQGSLRFQL